MEQLIHERKRNEELEEHLKQQETALKQSKDEIKKLTNSISEISLRFSEKLIQERESNQTLNSILNKDKQEKEHLQKVRKIVVLEGDLLCFLSRMRSFFGSVKCLNNNFANYKESSNLAPHEALKTTRFLYFIKKVFVVSEQSHPLPFPSQIAHLF